MSEDYFAKRKENRQRSNGRGGNASSRGRGRGRGRGKSSNTNGVMNWYQSRSGGNDEAEVGEQSTVEFAASSLEGTHISSIEQLDETTNSSPNDAIIEDGGDADEEDEKDGNDDSASVSDHFSYNSEACITVDDGHTAKRGRHINDSQRVMARGFTLNLNGRALLHEAEIHLEYGNRYGLIGKNGVGKTTLLKALASKVFPGFPDNITTLHVTQEIHGSDQTVLEEVLAADSLTLGLKKQENAFLTLLEQWDQKQTSRERQEEGTAGSDSSSSRLVPAYVIESINQLLDMSIPCETKVPSPSSPTSKGSNNQRNKSRNRRKGRSKSRSRSRSRNRGSNNQGHQTTDQHNDSTSSSTTTTSDKNQSKDTRISLDNAVHIVTDALNKVYDELSQFDQSEAEAEAQRILAQCGFSDSAMNRPTKELSGGWRMKVALAKALFRPPTLLLLDEPTNHLDMAGVLWVQDFLNSYPGTVVIVSHDSAFLTAVTTHILHFRVQKLNTVPLNYEAFVKDLEERRKKSIRLQANLDKKRDSARQMVSKMRERQAKMSKKGKKTSAITGKLGARISEANKKINKMGLEKTVDGKKWVTQSQGYGFRAGSVNANGGDWDKKARGRTAATTVEAIDKTLQISFPQANVTDIRAFDKSESVIQLDNVSFRYPSKSSSSFNPWVFQDVNLQISLESRIGLVGHNGAGKSTFIRVLLEKLKPTEGKVTSNLNLRIGFFSQHTIEMLPPSLTPVEALREGAPHLDWPDLDFRKHLARLGITGSIPLQTIGTLSGGQRARVALAKICLDAPHCLVLDEPTNHLDLESIKYLCQALKAYEGAVVVAAHDQTLLRSVCEQVWAVGNGRVSRVDLDSYIQQLAQEPMKILV